MLEDRRELGLEGVQPPVLLAGAAQVLFPQPADLIGRYDANASSGLDPQEVEELLHEIGLSLSSALVVAQMDPDDSGELERAELVPLAWITSKHLPESFRPPPVVAQEIPLPPVEPPPRALPLASERTHFRSLDLDGDGFVDEAELRERQSPAQLHVRLKAILSVMDRDGDARLSEAEFRSALSGETR